MYTINGRIKTVQFQETDFQLQGKKVFHPSYHTGASTFLTGESFETGFIEVCNDCKYTDEKGHEQIVRRVIDVVPTSSLKTIVVEFLKAVQDVSKIEESTKAEWITIPLENNEWEYALLNKFVDNDKLIEFEIINDVAFLNKLKKNSINELLKQREEIDSKILAINPMELVHYELEQLQKK